MYRRVTDTAAGGGKFCFTRSVVKNAQLVPYARIRLLLISRRAESIFLSGNFLLFFFYLVFFFFNLVIALLPVPFSSARGKHWRRNFTFGSKIIVYNSISPCRVAPLAETALLFYEFPAVRDACRT